MQLAPHTTPTHEPALYLPGPGATLHQLVAAWIAWKASVGAWSKRTATRTGGDVRDWATPGETPVAAVGEAFMRRYIARLGERGLSLASQRSRWYSVKELCGWATRKGWFARNPAEYVEREELPWANRRGRRLLALQGKPKLAGTDEAVRFIRAAQRRLDSAERLAVLLPLLCGLRSAEVRFLRVRDVDLSAAPPVVWVRGEHLKSLKSERVMRLPELLRDDARQLTQGRDPDALIFRSNRGACDAWEGRWLSRLTAHVCGLARVTPVGPHGLRGTFATLLHQLTAATMADVGRALGHDDATGDTARSHYATGPVRAPSLNLSLSQLH